MMIDDETLMYDDETMILMMILMTMLIMILMMVGAGTCILSKYPGGEFVYLKSSLGLNLWPEQRIKAF